MVEDVLMFVDDGFFGLVKKNFQREEGKSKRYLQTFRNICKNENLNLKHLFVYSAPPYQGSKPTKKEDFLMSKYQNMMKMLRNKKWITVREGRCQRLKIDGEFVYKQKGVDILISIDLMEIKDRYPNINKIILIACDSDFVPVIKNIQEKGIKVLLYTYFDGKRNSPFSRYNELLNVVSKWIKLRKEYFEDKNE